MAEVPGSSVDDSALTQAVLDCVGKTLGQQGVARIGDRIEDLGIGSLQFIQFVVLLENRLRIEFADEFLNFRRFDALSDVAQYARRLRPQS